MTFLMIAAGLVLLFAGGEALVRGAVALALRLGISPLLVGLTVVGFGTSLPELFTSVQAALAGSPAIALGNIVGSNIANVLLILGIAALLSPIAINQRKLMRDGTLLMISAAAFSLACATGHIGAAAGALLVAGLAGYLILLWRQERNVSTPDTDTATRQSLISACTFALVGIATVIFGARLLVLGAIDLARDYGVSETVIGLTVVAIGTSLPELATTVVCVLRRQPDLAFGNIVGSNIFNVLAIGGVTALVVPLEVPDAIRFVDVPVMLAVSAALILVAWTGSRIVRAEGALLLAGFVAHQYLIWT